MPASNPEQSIFLAALELPTPAERAAYLKGACGADSALLANVQELLAVHEKDDDFLDRPPPIATVDEHPVTERPGSVIGPYKLMEQIGEGGMGLVFVAEQQRPVRRKVALKVIKPGMDTRQVIARFEAERQALALMDHANIARVLDGGETDSGRPYFVMELVRGVPITAYCDQQQLAIRTRLEVFVHVCAAVQHAHQKGIIHRDLKPSNLLVVSHDGQPVVKVIDFGVAKAIGQQLTDKTVYTQFAHLIGTPLYMSPEQAGQSGLDIDTRSDLYALGVLLYELLTGTTPFDKDRLKAASHDELRRIIREEEPPRPSTRVSTVGQLATTIATHRKSEPRKLRQLLGGDLDWIVMKALEKDRNRRYESASAFAADVQRYLADEPVQACPPSTWYRYRKFARRNKRILAVAGLFLFFLVLLGGAGLWWVQQRAGAASEARLALAEASGLLEDERWREALSAARRAEAALAGIGADPDLRRQGHELIRDLEMAERLQEARLTGINARGSDRFYFEAPEAAYAAAFVEYGLDVAGLEAPAVAQEIRSRRIQTQLVAALDDWARVGKHLKRPGWRQRLAVARAADPDAWRNRLRDALEREDPKLLEEIAAAKEVDTWPVSTTALLGKLAQGTAASERVAAVLARAQQRHPSDFFINARLGILLREARPPRLEEAIRYWTAAVAVRPQSPTAHYSLAIMLGGKGRLDEAITEYREAIRFRNDFPEAHANLGMMLADQGRLEEAIAEYRLAIASRQDFPEAYLAHDDLGRALEKKGDLDGAIQAYQEALRLKKDYPDLHCNLGNALTAKRDLGGAIKAYQEALRLKKDYPEVHNNLGIVLADQGRLEEAIAEYRLAIASRQDFPEAHFAHRNLGNALRDKGQVDEAIKEYQEALRLKKDYPEAHADLGGMLVDQGRLEEAVAEYRLAIASGRDFPEAYLAYDDLGRALAKKGDLDGAITSYRKAIELDPKYAKAHCSLGVALDIKGQVDEAIAEFQEAIRIKRDYPEAHYNLGKALSGKGQPDEAIAEYREAIRIKKDYPEAHCNLGSALQQKGEFREALEALRRGHELGSTNPRWPYPSAQWVRDGERLLELDGKLAPILSRQKQPADAAERLALAQLCQLPCKKQYAAAASFFQEAFDAEPKLAEGLSTQHRYAAACAAALAGCGQGKDATNLDDRERTRLRQQALTWLRADLAAWRKQLESDEAKVRPVVQQTTQHWLRDTDFAGVRGPEALAKLPQGERQDWRKLWADVTDLFTKAGGKSPGRAK
jgi:tetratricopeptide (TPR) repeat protein